MYKHNKCTSLNCTYNNIYKIMDEIKNKIILLLNEIEKKQYDLKILLSEFFIDRVKSFLIFDPDNDNDNEIYKTVKSFYFSQNDNEWKCKYIHKTNNYTFNNYCIDSESEDDVMNPYPKKTKISFGYINGKYYIKCENDDIKVYTRKNLPKLFSLEYEYQSSMSQYEIMNIYSKNKNIPEWLAIRFLLQVFRQKFFPEKVKNYFNAFS